MSQHMKSGQDVCPLDHLSKRATLQHFWTEHITGFLCQKAHMHQDLKGAGKEVQNNILLY